MEICARINFSVNYKQSMPAKISHQKIELVKNIYRDFSKKLLELQKKQRGEISLLLKELDEKKIKAIQKKYAR